MANHSNPGDPKIQRASVIVPLFISLIFCCAEVLLPISRTIETGGFIALWKYCSWDTLIKLCTLFINYFAPTLIAAVIFMLIQQYYFHSPAGLDHGAVVFLAGTTSVYTLVYFAYTFSDVKYIFLKLLLFGGTIGFIILLWRSMEASVRQTKIGNSIFSGG